MTTFLTLLTLVLGGVLLLIAAMKPRRSHLSKFELERRLAANDKEAEAVARRERLLGDALSLQRIVVALLLVVVSLLLVVAWGWLLGIVAAVIIAVEYGTLARLDILQRYANVLYERVEPPLFRSIERFPRLFSLLRNVGQEPALDIRLESREQLLHLVADSGQLTSKDEKRMIARALEFDIRTVEEIMTPVSVIDSVDHAELLGPLVLDDLHKTGHSRFPVIEGDIHHVVGVLHLHDLLTLDTAKRTSTVAKTMEPRVFYIKEGQTLTHALGAFLRTRHHLFIVVNEFRETVGLLTLEDVMEALLGRRIVDEFDAHEDLRAVAARNPRGSNLPPSHIDV